MEKINLLLILGSISVFLIFILFFLTKKKEEQKEHFSEDLLLIKQAQVNTKKNKIIKVEAIGLKNDNFNKLYEKLCNKMQIYINPIKLSDNSIKNIEEAKRYILEEIEDISKRRKELLESS